MAITITITITATKIPAIRRQLAATISIKKTLIPAQSHPAKTTKKSALPLLTIINSQSLEDAQAG